MNNKNKTFYYSNFKRNNKWLGIIDYRLIIVLLVYILLIMKIITILDFSSELKLGIFCAFMVPILAFIIVSYREENAIEIVIFLIKFLLNRKIFIGVNIKKFRGQIYK